MSQNDNPLWKVLLDAGYGPDLDTAGALLHLAAGIYVMEGHTDCAQPILAKHLDGWVAGFKAEEKKHRPESE